MLRIRSSQDMLAGALFVFFGVVLLYGGWSLDPGTELRMGPGYVPRALSILLLIVGAVLVLKSLTVDGHRMGELNLRPLVFVLGAAIFFALTLEKLGLVAVTFLSVCIGGLATKDVRPLELLTIAAAMAAGCAILFVYGLKLQIQIWPTF